MIRTKNTFRTMHGNDCLGCVHRTTDAISGSLERPKLKPGDIILARVPVLIPGATRYTMEWHPARVLRNQGFRIRVMTEGGEITVDKYFTRRLTAKLLAGVDLSKLGG